LVFAGKPAVLWLMRSVVFNTQVSISGESANTA